VEGVRVNIILNRAGRRRLAWLIFAFTAGSGSPMNALAGDEPGHSLRLTAEECRDEQPSAPSTDKPWHFEFGFRDGHTKLAETKQMLDRRLDIPLAALDRFNLFDEPTTPIDRKSEFLLTTLYLGAGRQESDWLIWTVYLGGGAWRDHDHQRAAIANLEVNFKYGYFYTGATAEVYPWKAPKPADFESGREGLLASRPFLATGIETGYVSGEGRGYYKIAPFPRIYQDKVLVRDWITSFNFGVGWNFPLNHCWSVVLMGDYRFHTYQPDEYNSWTVTAALRYNLP
jgi:hypothetical protein